MACGIIDVLTAFRIAIVVVCLPSAIALMAYGKSGWGWLLFLAFCVM